MRRCFNSGLLWGVGPGGEVRRTRRTHGTGVPAQPGARPCQIAPPSIPGCAGRVQGRVHVARKITKMRPWRRARPCGRTAVRNGDASKAGSAGVTLAHARRRVRRPSRRSGGSAAPGRGDGGRSGRSARNTPGRRWPEGGAAAARTAGRPPSAAPSRTQRDVLVSKAASRGSATPSAASQASQRVMRAAVATSRRSSARVAPRPRARTPERAAWCTGPSRPGRASDASCPIRRDQGTQPPVDPGPGPRLLPPARRRGGRALRGGQRREAEADGRRFLRQQGPAGQHIRSQHVGPRTRTAPTATAAPDAAVALPPSPIADGSRCAA